MYNPKWLLRNTEQIKSQAHQTHTTLQHIASAEIMRVIPHERENKCSGGRYGQTVTKRWAVTLCPSFCWLEVLQRRVCPCKQAERMWDPTLAASRLRAHPGHGLSVGAPALCTAHSTLQAAAPGSPRDTVHRVHSLHQWQEAAVPDQCCRPAPWQSSFLPCCYGMDRNSVTAAEPITLRDRNSSQMTQDIVLRQTRSNFPMSSFKHNPFNKQPGFFQCLKSHGLNICMQLLQHQLVQLCLSSAAALSKYW